MTPRQSIKVPEDFSPVRKRNNSRNRKRMAILRRRINHLHERLEDYEGDPNYLEQEISTLEWARDICEEWINDDPLFDFVWTGTPLTDESSLQDMIDLLGSEASFRGQRCEIVGVTEKSPVQGRNAFQLTLRPLSDGEHSQRHVGSRVLR